MAFFSKAAATVAGFAAGAALADKIGGIVSQTQQAFNKTQFGDVAGAASAAGYKPITKFKTNDYPNVPNPFAGSEIDALTTKENFEVFNYPSDIGKYFIKFSFVSYKRIVALTTSIDDPTLVVIFPIPSNLNENFSVDYQNAKLGSVTGAAVETALKIIDKEATFGDVKTTAFESAVVAGREIARAGGETILANVDKATGVVPNPHLAAIFQDIGLRTHSFTFRFSPKNSQESQTLKKIIKKMKRRMLPGTAGSAEASTGPLFSFPDTVDISFGPNKEIPYIIKRSVLESMAVNYAPNGTPSFFKDGSPTDIEIALGFKEVRVVTRRDYEDDKQDKTVSPAPPTSATLAE